MNEENKSKESKSKESVTVSFVASKELMNAVYERAKADERSASWVIRKALEAYLK